MQGRRDIPLNARGRDEARRNGEVLARVMPQALAFDFAASPLGRARQTTEILRGAMGLAPEDYRIDHGLVEITFGEWEGFTLEELSAKAAQAVAAREADKWNFVPPGGESYAMLSERVEKWVASIGTDIVAVSHGGIARCLRGILTPIERAEIPLLPAPQDRILVFQAGAFAWH